MAERRARRRRAAPSASMARHAARRPVSAHALHSALQAEKSLRREGAARRYSPRFRAAKRARYALAERERHSAARVHAGALCYEFAMLQPILFNPLQIERRRRRQATRICRAHEGGGMPALRLCCVRGFAYAAPQARRNAPDAVTSVAPLVALPRWRGRVRLNSAGKAKESHSAAAARRQARRRRRAALRVRLSLLPRPNYHAAELLLRGATRHMRSCPLRAESSTARRCSARLEFAQLER